MVMFGVTGIQLLHMQLPKSSFDLDNSLGCFLVDNPDHHPQGDFVQLDDGQLSDQDGMRKTFSGIGVYQPTLFAQIAVGQPAKLAPLLRAAMAERKVLGNIHRGFWLDVGTPERLAALEYRLKQQH